MLRNGIKKISTPVKYTGTLMIGISAGMLFQSQKKQQLNSNDFRTHLHQQKIQKFSKMTPEVINQILEEEKTILAKTKQERKSMKIFVSENEKNIAIKKIAKQVAKEYQNEEHLIVLTMLNGASYFAADLKKELQQQGINFKEDAIRVTRYANNHQGGQPIIERLPEPEQIVGRKILIIEDLIEGGITLDFAKKALEEIGAKPENIKIAVLTDKINARHKGFEHVKPDFYGFTMEKNQWIVGAGCDQSGYLRAEPDILVFPEEEQRKFGYKK